jgi:hypothetical protein
MGAHALSKRDKPTTVKTTLVKGSIEDEVLVSQEHI